MTDLHELPEWREWAVLPSGAPRSVTKLYAEALITRLAGLVEQAEAINDQWEVKAAEIMRERNEASAEARTEILDSAWNTANERSERLAAELAERDEALVVAWRLCLQEAWQDLRVHLNNERREG